MFRDGQYLEVIKVSGNIMATAIITVKEKCIEIDNKQITTNKWLNLEDWSALFKIVQRALLRNRDRNHQNEAGRKGERRKSTQRMDVIYSYEAAKDSASLPTIKARVSPAKRRDLVNSLTPPSPPTDPKHAPKPPDQDEEYDPSSVIEDSQGIFRYIPSRKSLLKRLQQSEDPCTTSKHSSHSPYVPRKKSKHEPYEPSGGLTPDIAQSYIPTSKSSTATPDEYTPSSSSTPPEDTYVPNPIKTLKQKAQDEVYDPWESSPLPSELSGAYVPTSKGSSITVEEYEPDCSNMNPEISYVPSAKKRKREDSFKDKEPEESPEPKESKDRRKRSTKKKTFVNSDDKREL